MATDPFTDAARTEAESWIGMDLDDHDNFVSGAVWARDHLAAQEPTDAEVEAGANAIIALLTGVALSAARAARRDEEKR